MNCSFYNKALFYISETILYIFVSLTFLCKIYLYFQAMIFIEILLRDITGNKYDCYA